MVNIVIVSSHEYDNHWAIMLANFAERLKMNKKIALQIYLLALSLTRCQADRGCNYQDERLPIYKACLLRK